MRVTWDNTKLISYHVKISILIGPLSTPPPPPKAGKIKALLMGLREKRKSRTRGRAQGGVRARWCELD